MKSEKKYRIAWRNKITGQIGLGTKTFSKVDAEALAEELNRGYPNINHEAVEV